MNIAAAYNHFHYILSNTCNVPPVTEMFRFIWCCVWFNDQKIVDCLFSFVEDTNQIKLIMKSDQYDEKDSCAVFNCKWL